MFPLPLSRQEPVWALPVDTHFALVFIPRKHSRDEVTERMHGGAITVTSIGTKRSGTILIPPEFGDGADAESLRKVRYVNLIALRAWATASAAHGIEPWEVAPDD